MVLSIMGLTINNYIFKGYVSHYRFQPKIHKFKYRVFKLFMNLEQLEKLENKTIFFSLNKFNLFSFYYKDHTEKPYNNPINWVKNIFLSKNLYKKNDKIYILCYPRILGYVFNPLTTYFCIGDKDEIKAIIYEVHNTFKDRHYYLTKYNAKNEIAEKTFHVSPFFKIEGEYEFATKLNNNSLKVEIKYSKNKNNKNISLLNAVFYGKKTKFNNTNILIYFFTYPLMTIKIIYSIHLQAFFLWIKGIKFFNRPIPKINTISLSKTLINSDNKNDK